MTPEELRALAVERRAKFGNKETHLTKALDDAAAEIERLQAALKEIVTEPLVSRSAIDTLIHFRGIARIALAAADEQSPGDGK